MIYYIYSVSRKWSKATHIYICRVEPYIPYIMATPQHYRVFNAIVNQSDQLWLTRNNRYYFKSDSSKSFRHMIDYLIQYNMPFSVEYETFGLHPRTAIIILN